VNTGKVEQLMLISFIFMDMFLLLKLNTERIISNYVIIKK